MRPTIAALLLALAPLAARADPDAAPSPAAPQWSLGAGVISFGGSALGAISLNPSFQLPPNVPGAQASLERRLGDDTWLVVGLTGLFDRERLDLPAGASGQSRLDLAGVGLNAGVRRVLTPGGSLVDVSLVFLGNAGLLHARQDFAGITNGTQRQTAWRVGVSAGIAVDRELVSNLSLRVSTSLLGAGYTWGRTELSDGGSADGSVLSAGFQLAPSLELRLAF